MDPTVLVAAIFGLIVGPLLTAAALSLVRMGLRPAPAPAVEPPQATIDVATLATKQDLQQTANSLIQGMKVLQGTLQTVQSSILTKIDETHPEPAEEAAVDLAEMEAMRAAKPRPPDHVHTYHQTSVEQTNGKTIQTARCDDCGDIQRWEVAS